MMSVTNQQNTCLISIALVPEREKEQDIVNDHWRWKCKKDNEEDQ